MSRYIRCTRQWAGGPRILSPKLYIAWASMRQRCTRKPGHPDHAKYVKRGITLCEEWNDYSKFREWAITNGYRKGLSLDRIDNDGNYTPENCRWATNLQQAQNSRNCRWITFKGKTLCLNEWARQIGINRTTLFHRLRRGWPLEKALSR